MPDSGFCTDMKNDSDVSTSIIKNRLDPHRKLLRQEA